MVASYTLRDYLIFFWLAPVLKLAQNYTYYWEWCCGTLLKLWLAIPKMLCIPEEFTCNMRHLILAACIRSIFNATVRIIICYTACTRSWYSLYCTIRMHIPSVRWCRVFWSYQIHFSNVADIVECSSIVACTPVNESKSMRKMAAHNQDLYLH